MTYPEIKPLEEKANKLMVMMHGVGSDGNDLISLVPFMQNQLPDYHFFSPNGVEPYDMAPFGRQWFSLIDRAPETIIGLTAKNAPKALEMIQAKQQELGLTNADTILFGFSQGTMMSIYLTLVQEEPFAATIGFSGRLIPPATLKNTKTPICLIHGKDDDVVPASESEKMAEYFDANGISNQLLVVPNLTHSIDAGGMKFALKFLQAVIK